MRFNLNYFLYAILLFIIEVLIALYAHDNFIRPYLGDFLVVILIYCAAKSLLPFPVGTLALSVLLFSYVIEGLQYLNFVDFIGLGDSKLANVVIGNYFSWTDMLAYTLGILFVLSLERLKLIITERFKSKETKEWLFL